MSVGKYLSLEEARKKKLLERFAKEHPSTGDERAFDRMMGKMTAPYSRSKTPRKAKNTS
jgi:hypothetical protein